jgi:hypothetical protein
VETLAKIIAQINAASDMWDASFGALSEEETEKKAILDRAYDLLANAGIPIPDVLDPDVLGAARPAHPLLASLAHSHRQVFVDAERTRLALLLGNAERKNKIDLAESMAHQVMSDIGAHVGANLHMHAHASDVRKVLLAWRSAQTLRALFDQLMPNTAQGILDDTSVMAKSFHRHGKVTKSLLEQVWRFNDEIYTAILGHVINMNDGRTMRLDIPALAVRKPLFEAALVNNRQPGPTILDFSGINEVHYDATVILISYVAQRTNVRAGVVRFFNVHADVATALLATADRIGYQIDFAPDLDAIVPATIMDPAPI